MQVSAETIEKLLKIIEELKASLADVNKKLEEALKQHEKDLAKIDALTKKIKELTAKKVRKDSHNSSIPPSSEGYAKPAPKSLREKSGKKVGGQIGHKGKGMQITRKPDEEKYYYPSECEGCPHKGKCQYNCAGTHYVYDVEVNTTLVAHKILAAKCPMKSHRRIIGEYPERAIAPKQYGNKLKAFVGALLTAGYVSVDRVHQLLNGLGIPISTGTVQNIMNECLQKTEEAVKFIRKKVSSFDVLNCDETGCRVNGKLHWLHCICNSYWSYFAMHEKRGREAIEDIGILPTLEGSVLSHDFWHPYLQLFNVQHGFCNAHLERELVFAYESTGQKWAENAKLLLMEMCHRRNELHAEGNTAFSQEELSKYYEKYDSYVEEGLSLNPILDNRPSGRRGRIKKGKFRCLLERLRDYKSDILRFAEDWRVPFTNNEAERSIRFTKVKEKVSGCFRTKAGADKFVSVMSYISTAKKHGIFAYEALVKAFNDSALKLVESWE